MVTIVPVLYAARSKTRNSTVAAISLGVAERWNGKGRVKLLQRSGVPKRSFALPSASCRSPGPGLTPTKSPLAYTRCPAFGGDAVEPLMLHSLPCPDSRSSPLRYLGKPCSVRCVPGRIAFPTRPGCRSDEVSLHELWSFSVFVAEGEVPGTATVIPPQLASPCRQNICKAAPQSIDPSTNRRADLYQRRKDSRES